VIGDLLKQTDRTRSWIGENQISLTDPDSRAMVARTHVAVGYKCRLLRHGQSASHSNLNRFAKGARTLLEPQRVNG
jgi:hypothetical protein